MGGYPSDYYVMPDHQMRLSDDRTKIWIKQPLPGVRKSDLNVHLHEKGFCLDFNPEKKNPMHKCFTLAYKVNPDTAEAEFKDGVLTVTVGIERHGGKKIEIK